MKNYLIISGKIKVITQVINFNYETEEENSLIEKIVSGKRYVVKGEDYNDVLKMLEVELLKACNKNVQITVEDIDCKDFINYDSIEVSNEEDAETVIKNLTLEEQLFQTQFELESLKLGLSE